MLESKTFEEVQELASEWENERAYEQAIEIVDKHFEAHPEDERDEEELREEHAERILREMVTARLSRPKVKVEFELPAEDAELIYGILTNEWENGRFTNWSIDEDEANENFRADVSAGIVIHALRRAAIAGGQKITY